MQFQKISIPIPRKGNGKFPRGRGVSKAQFFRRKYGAKLDFLDECQGGGGGGVN